MVASKLSVILLLLFSCYGVKGFNANIWKLCEDTDPKSEDKIEIFQTLSTPAEKEDSCNVFEGSYMTAVFGFVVGTTDHFSNATSTYQFDGYDNKTTETPLKNLLNDLQVVSGEKLYALRMGIYIEDDVPNTDDVPEGTEGKYFVTFKGYNYDDVDESEEQSYCMMVKIFKGKNPREN